MSRLVRTALEGAAAAGCAAVAMVLVAAAGVWLLDVPVSGGLVAAVVALAVGGDVELSLEAGAITLQGTLDAMPLGVTLAGVLAFTLPLRRRNEPAPIRIGAALLSAIALAWLAVRLGRGTIELAGRGTVAFHADPWSTLLGAAAGSIAVLALCWLALNVEPVRRTVRAVAVVVLAATGLCLLGGVVAGLAGWALLVAPNVVGLGVPLVVEAPGVPDLDGRIRLVAAAFSVLVALAIGLLSARPIQAGLGAGSALLAGTLLSSVSGQAGFGGFDAIAIDVRGNPWLALLLGLAAGAVAGGIGAVIDKNRSHGKPARSR